MAICLGCDAEIDASEVEVGQILTCAECGAEMEVITLRPLELDLVDDTDEEEEADEELDEEDDDLDDDEEDS